MITSHPMMAAAETLLAQPPLPTEAPDIESSTDDYATRFSGRAGAYL